MGQMVARVRFAGSPPPLEDLMRAVAERLGCAQSPARLTAQGNTVRVQMGMNSVWMAYTLSVLSEHGATYVDYITGEPRPYLPPLYVAVPWLSYPHSRRVAIDDEANAATMYAPAWRRFRPRCMDIIWNNPSNIALVKEIGADPDSPEWFERLDRLDPATQRDVVTHVAKLACHATDPDEAELGRAALWCVPYSILYRYLPSMAATIDLNDERQCRMFLETLCVVAPFDALGYAMTWQREAPAAARSTAEVILRIGGV